MARFIVLGVAILVIAQAQGTISKAPKDFWLRLEFGCAGTDVVDTAAATYVRNNSRPQIAHVRVSTALKDRLFTLLNDARFFEMPSRVASFGICEPNTRYTLQVGSNGRTHAVSWSECGMGPEKDAIDPNDNETYRVNALKNLILRPFQEMGAVKSLRRPDWLCL